MHFFYELIKLYLLILNTIDELIILNINLSSIDSLVLFYNWNINTSRIDLFLGLPGLLTSNIKSINLEKLLTINH